MGNLTETITKQFRQKRRHASPGKMLQLYFGMRSQHCRQIMPDVACTWVDRIRINFGWGEKPKAAR